MCTVELYGTWFDTNEVLSYKADLSRCARLTSPDRQEQEPVAWAAEVAVHKLLVNKLVDLPKRIPVKVFMPNVVSLAGKLSLVSCGWWLPTEWSGFVCYGRCMVFAEVETFCC